MRSSLDQRLERPVGPRVAYCCICTSDRHLEAARVAFYGRCASGNYLLIELKTSWLYFSNTPVRLAIVRTHAVLIARESAQTEPSASDRAATCKHNTDPH